MLKVAVFGILFIVVATTANPPPNAGWGQWPGNWQRDWNSWQWQGGDKWQWSPQDDWTWKRQDWSWKWECPNRRIGFTPECPAMSCKQITRVNPWAPDGKYWVRMWDEDVVFPVWCDMTDGGWTLTYRVPSGIEMERKWKVHTPADIWESMIDFESWKVTWPWKMRKDMLPQPYKNRIVKNWNNMGIEKVKMVIIDNEQPVKTMWFDAKNSNANSWFSWDRLIRVWPAWTDMQDARWQNQTWANNGLQFTMSGDIRPWREVERSWMINRKWGQAIGGCVLDEGWFVAINARASQPSKMTKTCPWERRWSGMHWLYSKKTTMTRWSREDEVGIADSVLIYVW